MQSATAHRTLAAGEMLNWYRIDAVLGRGGFGVIYRATDTNLDHPVAIKEYIPHGFAERDGQTTVRPIGVQHDDLYQWGLKRFIKEARNLVRFKHPNIVRVMSVFQQNNTAYMVMEFEAGMELGRHLASPEACTEASLKALIGPVCEGLLEVHRHGFIHRDIKPANILVRPDGSPVLLDFGSARDASLEQNGGLTALVTIGYAPLEQYDHAEHEQQGPWTDIYALGGVLYFAISGNEPVDSARRASAVLNGGRDPLIAAATIGRGRYGARFLAAIDWALEFRIADRPQSVLDWLPALLGAASSSARPPNAALFGAVSMDSAAGATGAGERSRAPAPIGDTGERSPTSTSRPSRARAEAPRPEARGTGRAAVPDNARYRTTQSATGATGASEPTWPRRMRARIARLSGLRGGPRRARAQLALALLTIAVLSGAVLSGVLLRPDEPEPIVPDVDVPTSAEADSRDEQRERLAELVQREQAFEQRQARAVADAEQQRLQRIARVENERLAEEQATRQAQDRLAEQQRLIQVRRAQELAEASRRFTDALDEAEAALEERRIGAARASLDVAAETGFSGRRLGEVRERLDATLAEMRRPVSDLEFDRVVQRFDRLKRAIENQDRALIDELTLPSDQLALFLQLMEGFEKLNMEITGIRVRNADKSVSANLRIRDMVRENGDRAVPSEAFRDRDITSRLKEGAWTPIAW